MTESSDTNLEARLAECEATLRLLVDGSRDYAIILLDALGRIAVWNEGAYRLLGYTEAEAVGRTAALTFTTEDRSAGKPEWEMATASSQGRAEDESWAVRKDGTRFWASGVLMAQRDDAGRLRGFVEIFRDQTERRRQEQALQESELRLRLALTAARMGTWYWEVDADRDRLDENLMQLLGRPQGDTIKALGDFIACLHPDDQQAFADAIHRSTHDGVGLNIEFRVVWPDGSVHWLRDQGDVIRDEQGRPCTVAGACVDITERKQMEDALRRAHDELEQRVQERTAELRRAQEQALQAERLAAIGQTVAGLAHEGRNALQTIHACAERLAWRLGARREELALLGEIQQAKDNLSLLFDDVRHYAAPIRIQRQPCDLAGVWREAWDQALARHPGRDAQLQEQAGGTDRKCLIDPFRFGQVFFNIFDNSLAAGPAAVRVTVSWEEAEVEGRPGLRIRVRDNGPGLTSEQRQNIFEPFYTTKTRGTGLGMAIARRILEAHGGRVHAGTGNGPGAEIVITLPRSGT